MKKKIIIVCVVIMVIFIILGGLFMASLYTSFEDAFEANWGIVLPDGMKEEFYQAGELGFQGDGIRYNIFVVDEDENFFSDFEDEEDSKIESRILELLDIINVNAKHRPNFTHPYIWKHVNIGWGMFEGDGDHLYMLYDLETHELFILQDIL